MKVIQNALTDNSLMLLFPNYCGKIYWEIKSFDGKEIFEGETKVYGFIKISFSNLNPGKYLLNVKTSTTRYEEIFIAS
jgi:hypothetical protein